MWYRIMHPSRSNDRRCRQFTRRATTPVLEVPEGQLSGYLGDGFAGVWDMWDPIWRFGMGAGGENREFG